MLVASARLEVRAQRLEEMHADAEVAVIHVPKEWRCGLQGVIQEPKAKRQFCDASPHRSREVACILRVFDRIEAEPEAAYAALSGYSAGMQVTARAVVEEATNQRWCDPCSVSGSEFPCL